MFPSCYCGALRHILFTEIAVRHCKKTSWHLYGYPTSSGIVRYYKQRRMETNQPTDDYPEQ
jgi:hypothetical protein